MRFLSICLCFVVWRHHTQPRRSTIAAAFFYRFTSFSTLYSIKEMVMFCNSGQVSSKGFTEHEYTKIYGDIVALYVFYWPLHQQFPCDIQRTTGERVLSEITQCLHAVVKANAIDSLCDKERYLVQSYLAEVAVSIDIIKALLTLCRQLKWITQGTLAVLTAHMSQITRNINSWRLRLACPATLATSEPSHE